MCVHVRVYECVDMCIHVCVCVCEGGWEGVGVHICMVWCVTVFVCHCPATKVFIRYRLIAGYWMSGGDHEVLMQGVKGGHVTIVCVCFCVCVCV